MNINGREWSKEAVQTLYIRLGDFVSLVRRLGANPAELRAQLKQEGILPPSEYVRNLGQTDPVKLKEVVLREGGVGPAAAFFNVSVTHLRRVLADAGFNWQNPRPVPGPGRFDLINHYIQNPDELRDVIIQAGGYPQAAKWLGISESYLRRHLDKLKIQHRHIPPEANDAAAAMEEFGSVALAAYHLGTSVTMFKKALENWRDLRDPLKTGNNAVATGRVGENYYHKLRQQHIVGETSSLENHSQPGYDFEDAEFGKVNVKTANPVRLKGRKGYVWSWGVDMGLESDYFALVALDSTRNPIGLFMISNRQTEGLPEGLNWNCWANGTCGFYYRAKTDKPDIGVPPGFSG